MENEQDKLPILSTLAKHFFSALIVSIIISILYELIWPTNCHPSMIMCISVGFVIMLFGLIFSVLFGIAATIYCTIKYKNNKLLIKKIINIEKKIIKIGGLGLIIGYFFYFSLDLFSALFDIFKELLQLLL